MFLLKHLYFTIKAKRQFREPKNEKPEFIILILFSVKYAYFKISLNKKVISGGILRAHLGLYGFIAGSLVGALFGTVFGIFRYGQLKLSESTYEEQRYKFLREKIIQKK